MVTSPPVQTGYYLDLTVPEIHRDFSTSANEDLEVCSHITENSNCNQNWVEAWKLVFDVYCVCHIEYFGPQIEEIGCRFLP